MRTPVYDWKTAFRPPTFDEDMIEWIMIVSLGMMFWMCDWILSKIKPLAVVAVFIVCSPVQAEVIYSVYEGSTLELQFESSAILTPTPPNLSVMMSSLGIHFDQVGAVVTTFGIIEPIASVGQIRITSNSIYMHAVNSLTLDFNSGLPTSSGTYSLVPMTVVDFPNVVSGSYYQGGMQTDLQRFPSATVPLDTVDVTEHPEPASCLLMVIGLIGLGGKRWLDRGFRNSHLF